MEGLIPLSMGWYFYLDFVRSAGKNPISDDATKMQVDTSEFLETMELWLRWLDNRIIFDHPAENQTWGVREEYRHAKNNVAFEHQGVLSYSPPSASSRRRRSRWSTCHCTRWAR